MQAQTILFDVDGTLLDTREFILAAFEHSARVHCFALPSRETLSRRIGDPLEDIYASFAGYAMAAADRRLDGRRHTA